jgi:type I restriction enzyme, S subunit
MSFPAYDEYKDSGVEWLKEIPRNWRAVPIKHVGRLKGGAGFPHDDQGVEGEILDFHKVNALSRADAHGYLVPSDNTISPDTANRLGAFVFPPETIVFAKVGAALLLARIRIIRNDSCIDNNMMGLIVHQDSFDVSFVRYAMELDVDPAIDVA